MLAMQRAAARAAAEAAGDPAALLRKQEQQLQTLLKHLLHHLLDRVHATQRSLIAELTRTELLQLEGAAEICAQPASPAEVGSNPTS